MKNQVITVLITLLVVAVLEVGVFFIGKDYFLGSKEETKTEETNKNNESGEKEQEKDDNTEEKESNKEEDDTLVGTFVVTYTDKTPKDFFNEPSFLIIKEDGTYTFNYNNCDMFYHIKGNYEIKDNILTLVGSKKHRPEHFDEDISFKIVSPTEVYLSSEDGISCTIGAKDYQKGYGSFKKIY